MNTIFWSLFGEIDESSFQLDENGYGAIWKTGMVLFGAFNIVAVLVALNMLIAILNDSYIRITVIASKIIYPPRVKKVLYKAKTLELNVTDNLSNQKETQWLWLVKRTCTSCSLNE